MEIFFHWKMPTWKKNFAWGIGLVSSTISMQKYFQIVLEAFCQSENTC